MLIFWVLTEDDNVSTVASFGMTNINYFIRSRNVMKIWFLCALCWKSCDSTESLVATKPTQKTYLDQDATCDNSSGTSLILSILSCCHHWHMIQREGWISQLKTITIWEKIYIELWTYFVCQPRTLKPFAVLHLGCGPWEFCHLPMKDSQESPGLCLWHGPPTQGQRAPSENASAGVATAHAFNKTENWKWGMFREKNRLKHSVRRQMMFCLPRTLQNLPLTREESTILLEIVHCFQDSSAESWCQMLWPLPQAIHSLAELSEGSRWWGYLQGKNRRQPISSSHMWPPSLLKRWTIYISISLYTRKRCSACCWHIKGRTDTEEQQENTVVPLTYRELCSKPPVAAWDRRQYRPQHTLCFSICKHIYGKVSFMN